MARRIDCAILKCTTVVCIVAYPAKVLRYCDAFVKVRTGICDVPHIAKLKSANMRPGFVINSFEVTTETATAFGGHHLDGKEGIVATRIRKK